MLEEVGLYGDMPEPRAIIEANDRLGDIPGLSGSTQVFCFDNQRFRRYRYDRSFDPGLAYGGCENPYARTRFQVRQYRTRFIDVLLGPENGYPG